MLTDFADSLPDYANYWPERVRANQQTM